MKLPRWTHSLKWRIVASYSLILIVGGVSTSAIGIYVTDKALLSQARQQVDRGLAASRTIYANRLSQMRQCVELLAGGDGWPEILVSNQENNTPAYLTRARLDRDFDFLSLADKTGRVVLQSSGVSTPGYNVADLTPVARALLGEPAASTELIPLAILTAENPALAQRVRGNVAATSDSFDAGMVLLAAAPITDEAGGIIGVLYAGQLLNEFDTELGSESGKGLIAQITNILFPQPHAENQQRGAVTIFQDGVRIATNVMTDDGRRAVGTRVSEEVYEAVMNKGRTWNERAFVVNGWYITAYEPLTNLAGERIGILGVGLLERPFTAVRDSVTLIFAAIALFCFALIVVVTYFLTRSFVRPLEEMVAVAAEIAGGDTSHRVRVTDQSELGVLAGSFNTMLDRLDEMTVQRYSLLEQDTQQWTQTLEQKVQERTEQLAKTQAAMGRHQRLASLGQLAAGVAHEINNPLGGILTFASLVLEDLPTDSPLRPDVEEIVAQADRCRKIVQELLEFSRQRAASTSARNINEVIDRTLAMLEKQASFQNIKTVRRLDPDLPPAVVDESQMQQVFMNIILNAVQAMEERGTLTIETGHDGNRNEIYARVTDTGCGIPKSIREAIFDPFFTTKDPGQGTGLGLAVVCRIVQSHGGRVEVDSEEGQGTTLTIILPPAETGSA
ncbi:MAG: cache domain-containing protein [Phycisphaerae bacterium]|nr:cache domain-containing protein [Phycisphaerae bacterium]